MPYTQNYFRKTQIRISSEPVDSLKHESLVLGFFSDERPPKGYCGFVDWRLNGMISKHIARGKITGHFKEKVLITPHYRIPSSKILLFGLGESTHLTYDQLYTAGYLIGQTLMQIKSYDTAFDIPGPGRCSLEIPKMTTEMISGFTDASLENQSKEDIITCILGDDSCRDEITLGANQFKVNVKTKLKVTIIEA
jgi:hypothetical protein